MTAIATTKGLCVYWRGCNSPVVRGSYFCAAHRPCTRCGKPPAPPKLTRGMCTRCYSWWRRHKSPARPAILERDRVRAAARRAAAA